MKILVLGGTQFIGRHVVARAVANGHDVTVLTRGLTSADLPDSVERLTGDRNDGAAGISAIQGRAWDACIDISGYTPVQVQASALSLKSSIHRYLFISTVAVYNGNGDQPLTENHELVPPAPHEITSVSRETYGALKVTCENIVTDVYGTRATILRPQIVAGPFDHTGRHTYWVKRGIDGGEVAMPGDGTDFVQVIDARDLAAFAIKVIEDDITGTYDIAGPRLTWKEFAGALNIQNPVWIPVANMEGSAAELARFPLYVPAHSKQHALFMNVSAAKAIAAGLLHTPAATTIADTREWSQKQDYPNAITRVQEAELISLIRSLE